MGLSKSNHLLLLSIHGEPVPEAMIQIQKVMSASSRLRFEAHSGIQKSYLSLDTANKAIILVSLQRPGELYTLGELLKAYATSIQNGVIRILVINNFAQPRNLQDLLTKGCAEIIPAAITTVELLTRIQQSVSSLDASFVVSEATKDTALDEFGITQDDLKGQKIKVNEFKYLEEDEKPWKKGADAFQSIELTVQMKRPKAKNPATWLKVLLIENSGTGVLVEVPKDSGESPVETGEEISLHIVAKNGDPALNFDVAGKVTSVDTPESSSVTVVGIAPLSGSIEKLISLADQFTKRQDEVQEFFKAAKGT